MIPLAGGRKVGSINEALRQINIALFMQVSGKLLEDGRHNLFSRPLLKASVRSLVWRISLRQILPRCTRP